MRDPRQCGTQSKIEVLLFRLRIPATNQQHLYALNVRCLMQTDI
jgi:hypothetical protein